MNPNYDGPVGNGVTPPGMTAVPTGGGVTTGGPFDAEMTPEEQKRRNSGICCFNMLGLVSTAAFICGIYSYAHCDFLSRYVTLGPDYAAGDYASACTDLGYGGGGGDNADSTDSQLCQSLLQNHGIGFTYWQATIPVDQTMCFSYTQIKPWGWVTPDFDSAFNASRWFSMIGYVFGGAAWFTLSCSACCRIDQKRLKGIACYFWVACFFQGMSLLMFSSNVCDKGFFASYFIPPSQMNNQTLLDEYSSVVNDIECTLSLGSKMAISATVLYFICSLMVPFSVVPFYVQRSYQSDYTDPPQQQQGQQPQGPPPPQGQEPVVQGTVTGNV